jgi:hypothetical protein
MNTYWKLKIEYKMSSNHSLERHEIRINLKRIVAAQRNSLNNKTKLRKKLYKERREQSLITPSSVVGQKNDDKSRQEWQSTAHKRRTDNGREKGVTNNLVDCSDGTVDVMEF